MAAEQWTSAEAQLVLRRAAELEHRKPEDERLSASEIEELAREVGLTPAAVEQALAELRAGTLASPRGPRPLERVLGPQAVVVERVVAGSAPEIQRRVDRLLTAQLLRKKRDFGARALWESASGFWPKLRRALDIGGQLTLGPVRELESSVVDAGEGHVRVRFAVDVGALQRKVIGVTALGTAAGVAVAVTLSLMAAPHMLEWIAAAGLTGSGALASLRFYRREIGATATALEHLCDRLERERAPASPLDLIFAR
jgi:hypothetical protein